jgi:hypothetical protein
MGCFKSKGEGGRKGEKMKTGPTIESDKEAARERDTGTIGI